MHEVLLTLGEYLDADDLTLSNLSTAGDTGEVDLPSPVYEAVPLVEVERRHVAATLDATSWNKSKAAEILGIERSTLDRKIRRFGLKRPG